MTIDCVEAVWIKEHQDAGWTQVSRWVHKINGHTFYDNKFYPMRYHESGYKRQVLDLTSPGNSWVDA